MAGDSAQPKVWKGDLTVVYLDPPTAPSIPLAYMAEQHASPRCERALKRGSKRDADPQALWCEMCVTDNPAEATVRLVNGEWRKAS